MSEQSIIIIDDEEDIIELFEYHLSKEGYIITGVTSVQSALKLSAEVPPPQAIILEIMLYPKNCIKVCNRINIYRNRANNQIAFLIMTTNSEYALDKSLDCGADGYIIKPFSIKEMVCTIKNNLNKKILH